MSDVGHRITFRTDRLGMPLIETVTAPDLATPDEVEEAILLVGRVCRSTGHVRTGPGASRQDVNVSVRGGRRVEIKGVSQAWRAAELVHGEAVRQLRLLELADELRRRGFAQDDDVGVEHRDVTRFFSSSPLTFLHQEAWERFLEAEGRRPGFEQGEGPFTVRALRLPALAGTVSWPCQPELTFADELAGRVRVIATLDQQPILLHSEKWPDYEGSHQELRRLKRKMRVTGDDALVVVWGAERDTVTAAEEIRLRYVAALDGVPHETRQPLPEGHTSFERILPGPERMYPDTDSPPQRVTRERVERLRLGLPEPPWEREARYAAAGVARDTIHYLIRRGGARLVDRVVEEHGTDLGRACRFFGEEAKGLRRAGVDVDAIGAERWCELFGRFRRYPVQWEARRELVERVAGRPDRTVDETLAEFETAEPAGWQERWTEQARRANPHGEMTRDQRFRDLMGRAMRELRGKVPGRRVAETLREAMGAT